jgi:carbonic anhydrase
MTFNGAAAPAVSYFAELKCAGKPGEAIPKMVGVPRLEAKFLAFRWIRRPAPEVSMNDYMRASRREFMTLAATFGLASSRTMTAAPQQQGGRRSLNADQALRELLDGNRRFMSGNRTTPRGRPEDFLALAHGQFPEAVVVSCADSRVPPEILFDAGVGDIFVVRLAGNVIGGAGVSVKGSIEFAVAEQNVPLILVLGHSGCGAAIQHIDDRDSLPGAINGLVELIKPAATMSKGMPGDPLENAIRKNVEIGVERLQGLEPIVAPRVKDGRVKVVGGVYQLHDGSVTLIDTKKISHA